MQIIITDAYFAKIKTITLHAKHIIAVCFVLLLLLAMVGMGTYWLFGKSQASDALGILNNKNQQSRYIQTNVELLATKIGQMQAQVEQLKALDARIVDLVNTQKQTEQIKIQAARTQIDKNNINGIKNTPPAVNKETVKENKGVKPTIHYTAPAKANNKTLDVQKDELAPVKTTDTLGSGGALLGGVPLTFEQMQAALDDLQIQINQKTDLLTVLESRLFEQKLKTLLLPTQHPVAQSNLGSRFGWRIDPMTGVSALHAGLDFPAPTGTSIVAAAAGIVTRQQKHEDFGNMIEIDHQQGIISRYAHTSKVYVKLGQVVQRGDLIAEVGSTGRSTGPHLHFEVLVNGVPQNPEIFLSAGSAASKTAMKIK